jgi:hypothetical protein
VGAKHAEEARVRGHGGRKQKMKGSIMNDPCRELRSGEPDDYDEGDDEVRQIFVSLIGFVASARISDAKKNQALDDIQKLQARLLP